MIYGSAIFRYRPDFGWMAVDWLPYYPAVPGARHVLIIRDADGRPALMRLTAVYFRPPRLGRFCKRPHRLAVLLPSKPEALPRHKRDHRTAARISCTAEEMTA